MATEQTWRFVDTAWDSLVVPKLSEYITVPNLSPLFDKDWKTNGLLEKAAVLLHDWAKSQQVEGLTSQVLRLPEKTPLIYLTVLSSDPTIDNATVLMYGHLDKPPPTGTWAEGLHPYNPVFKDGKLYGRGGADGGYAIFAAILSIKALQLQGIPHGRIVILIEASEVSGSVHLPIYIEHLEKEIGTPSLIVCLNSSAGNYEQFWITTTLRGLISGDLTIKVLHKECQSGQPAGSIVPSTFRILQQLLNRIEDPVTGEIKIQDIFVEIPKYRYEETKSCAESLGKSVYTEFSFVDNAKPVTDDIVTLLLNRTWRPALSITGLDGMPDLISAGNVLCPYTTVKLSLHLPPTANANICTTILNDILTKDPPYGTQVTFMVDKSISGCDTPPLAPWLAYSAHKSSNFFFKKPANFIGEGGSIPFMGMLQEKFPEAQFIITGVLGPQSNAHVPNEFLHIDFGKKVTACVTSIVADHFVHCSTQKK